MIDLDSKSLSLVKTILKKHIQDIPVYAFGSRVTGTAKQYSDLDLVIKDKQATPVEVINAIKFDFSDSNLPILS